MSTCAGIYEFYFYITISQITEYIKVLTYKDGIAPIRKGKGRVYGH